MNKISFFLQFTRAYSLPMSFMAWLIPFSFGLLNGGNFVYGLLALIGIVFAHLGANLFDDIIDYRAFLKKREQNSALNILKGKCKFFIEEKINIKQALLISCCLFLIAFCIGAFFVYVYKLPILIIMIVTGILCLLYPKSGYLGLSEIIIGIIFSPLVFTGVYYVMTGTFSQKLLLMSVSFAIVTVALLYTDFFLDYNSDKQAGKKTLVVLCGGKSNAYHLYIFLLFLIYANIFFGIHSHIFSTAYFLIFLSIVPALGTIENLQHYIDKEIKEEKEFLKIMNGVQKFIAAFSLLCVISFFVGS